MGEVYLVTDREHPERGVLALKTIFPSLMQDSEVVARFESEAKLLASIHHPNVVRLVEWGTFENRGKPTHFMAMEYIEGISLHALSRRRRLSLADVLEISLQIAKGLEETHAAHVVHRDLKPANIMITRDGLAKIIDFGIAKPAEMGLESQEDPERGFKTKTGMVIGTVNYIAPDILRGEIASETTDIYALGLIIWEMINGQTPFMSKNLAETMNRVISENLVWSDAIFDIAPPGFTKLVARLAAKDPQKRIPNAKSAVQEFEKIRSSANWSGRFGRKTRFDLDINWDPATIEGVRNQGVKESDMGFVLQEIEEQLIEQRDPRLVGTQPIAVDSDLIKNSIESYKSMRHRAALTKAARVRVQLGSTVPVSSANVKALHTTPLVKPIRPKRDHSGTFRVLRKTISTIVSLSIVFGVGRYVFNRAGNRIREVASENEHLTQGLNNLITAQANLAAPIATVGSDLSYFSKVRTLTGSELISQQTRKLSEVNAKETIWVVDQRTLVKTPRDLIPLETFFNPIYRSLETPTNLKNVEPITVFKAGEKFSVEIEDPISNSNEETRCTILNSRSQTLVNRTQEAWKIECLRKVTRAGQLTHRVLEVYEYMPAVASIYAVSTKAEEVVPAGMLAASTTRQLELRLELSTLQQSNPKELSPW